MWFKFVILTVASAAGRRSDRENFRDHYLALPKTDFESFGSSDGFAGRDMHSEFSGRSSGERREMSDPQINHRGFETEYSHRQFHRSSSGHGNDRDSGGQSHFGSESHGRELVRHDHMTTENAFHHKTNVQRSDRGIETLDHDVGAEHFDRGTKIHDRSIESHHRNTGQSGGFQGSSNGFQSFISGGFGSNGFEGGSIDNHNHRSINSEFHGNSGMRRTNTERHDFEVDDLKRRTEYQDRSAEHEHVDLSAQTNKNKEQFEIISTNNKRKFDDEHTRHNNENRNSGLSSNNDNEYNNREVGNQNLHTNTKNVNMPNIGTENTQRHQNTDSETRDQNSDNQMSNNSRVSSKRKQTPDVKTVADNEVSRNSSNTTSTDVNSTRTNQSREIDDDRWIWGDEEKKKTMATTKSPETVTLDDRAAFDGDKCPTGTIKVGGICATVD